MKTERIIIAGGRDFNDYELLKTEVDRIIAQLDCDAVVIISGTARGADQLGEKFAADNNLFVERFPADWEKNGRGAGHIRNAQMADVADVLIAFHDKVSKGTAGMIKVAKKKGLDVHVFNYGDK